MLTNFVAVAAGLAATASAFDCSGPYFSFYNRGGPAMSIQRLDPALFPGQESPHLHSFDGGNAVAADMTFETTQKSTCTTARIKPDKSLYWRPTLFWNGNNTGYYRVPEKFLKVYYKFGDAGNVRANVTEFPEDFAMIAGDPFKRADGDNPGGVKWACLGDNYSRIDANGFPKGFTSCKEGLTSEITFPACWNGKALDPKNPSAHMAWPNGNGKGLDACPDGFKYARFPTIFIEFWYDVSAFDGHYSADSVPWVLSNGDPTGYGWHADFRNGWEKGVLAKATAETGYCNCGCGCGNDQMKTCFGADNVNDDSDEAFKTCAATPQFPGDDKSPLEKLPGCNPIQSGPARATQATGPDCTAVAAPGGSNSATAPPVSSAGASSTGAVSAPASSSKSASAADVKTTPQATTPAGTSVAASSSASSVSLSLEDKGNGHQTVGGDDTKPTATETQKGYVDAYCPHACLQIMLTFFSAGSTTTDIPSLSLLSSSNSPAHTTAPAAGSGTCAAPTTITVTPTVYVTAGAVGGSATTSCDLGTVTHTVTNKVTVTVPASGGYKHKRHMDMHLHKN